MGESKKSFMDIHRLYDDVADKWARDEPILRDDLISRPIIVELARKYCNSGIVLDCGCGDGNVSRQVSHYAKRIIGLDFSRRMLSEAQKLSHKFGNIDYIRGDILDLGKILKPETIDLCLAIYAVCCMRDSEELSRSFEQIYSVLKVGAFAIIQLPHPLDGYFSEPSEWFNDVNSQRSYFDAGRLVRRKLRTISGDWILVARYHYPIYQYFNSISSAGFSIKSIFEPKPTPEILEKYPSLERESQVPSSLILLAQR